MEDHTLIANELTGTGNTAHLPKPLNAAATCCSCESFLLAVVVDAGFVVDVDVEVDVALPLPADEVVLLFLVLIVALFGASVLFLSLVPEPTAVGKGAN